MKEISLNGITVDLRQSKEEKATYDGILAKAAYEKNIWMNKKNFGTNDTEVSNLRKKIAKGVLNYGNYINTRAGSY